MSACDPLTYSGVTLSIWSAIKARVEAAIPTMPDMGDTGSGVYDGITLEWVYANETLTLTCTDSPWYLSCAMINGEIDGMIRPLLP